MSTHDIHRKKSDACKIERIHWTEKGGRNGGKGANNEELARQSNDPVQLFQKSVNIQSVHACTMFQGFEICNLTFETFKPVFFENLERLRIKPYYVANEHFFRDHSAPFQKGKGEWCPHSPFNLTME